MPRAASGHRGGFVRWRAQSFFERDPASVEKPPERRNGDRDALLRQQGAQFDQRDIALAGDSVEDEIRMGLDLVRMPISALWPGPGIALLCVKSAIPNRARRTDAKPLGCLASRHAARNGGNDAFTKVKRQRLHHARQPPSPARILNQNEGDSGIPVDSFRQETALAVAELATVSPGLIEGAFHIGSAVAKGVSATLR